MNISVEKWLALLALGIISMFLGCIPYLVIRFKKGILIKTDSPIYKLLLTILSCFGGGVLLSTSLLHFLPEIREKLENVPEIWETFDAHFPVAEMFTLCGFALIYLVEEIASFIMANSSHIFHHGHSHGNGAASRNSIAQHNFMAHASPNIRNSMTLNDMEDGCPCPKSVLDKKEESQSDHCADHSHQEPNLSSSIRSFMALIALSFHEVMEGIAIGIQSESDVWVMFGAVASHKFVISFVMGMELCNSNANLYTYFGSILFFSIVSPIGIVIGAAISSGTGSTDSVGVVVIEGLVCGTLLYVVFFEILNRERERKTFAMLNSRAVGFIQFISLIIGLVAMGCLTTLTHNHSDHAGHEDEHDHDHKLLENCTTLHNL